MPEMNLCLDCGLCCDGTMFSVGSLRDTDCPEQLVELGVGVSYEPKRILLNQPCSAFKSHCCSIYDARPTICREYRCALLLSCDSGDLTPVDALTFIQDTIALRDRLRKQMEHFIGVDASIAFPRLSRQVMAKLEQIEAANLKHDKAQMLLDLGTLRVLLAKYFKPKGMQSAEPDECDDNARSETGIVTQGPSAQALGIKN